MDSSSAVENAEVLDCVDYANAVSEAVAIERLREAGILQDLPEGTEIERKREVRDSLSTIGSIAAAELKAVEERAQTDHARGVTLSLEDEPRSPGGRTHMYSPGRAPIYNGQEEDTRAIMVSRVQLQRMLEDDEVLCNICGTNRAIDVVRRFRVDFSGVDPYEAVADLQASVAKKLQELEEQGMNLSFDEMQTLKTVSQELHSALTEAQKEWRAELLSVLQMSSLLSVTLIELTKKIERVQMNHNALSAKVGGS